MKDLLWQQLTKESGRQTWHMPIKGPYPSETTDHNAVVLQMVIKIICRRFLYSPS